MKHDRECSLLLMFTRKLVNVNVPRLSGCSPARIRALYAEILEKDAVIKIFRQRLHPDQGRKDGPCPRYGLPKGGGLGAPLRPASSTPAISIATCTSKSRGKGPVFSFLSFFGSFNQSPCS